MTELYNTLTKPELIMGLVVLLGAIFLALQKLGLVAVSFRRGDDDFAKRNHEPVAPTPESGTTVGKCPDPGCSANVRQTHDDIKELKLDFKDFKKEVFTRINAMSDDVAFIRGRLKGG